MAKPNNNIFKRVVSVAVLGAASLSATEWQFTAPSLFDAASSYQPSSMSVWSGQTSMAVSAASSSGANWVVTSGVGPSAAAWGVSNSAPVYSDDVFRGYLYTGSGADLASGNGSFSSAWTTYNSNSSSAGVWGGSSSTSSSAWSGDSWSGSSNSGAWSGAWATSSSSNSGAWGGAWGSSSSSAWGGSGGSTDYAACTAVTSWAATSTASSSSAPVWGGGYAAASAPVSTCTSTISNLAPSSNLQATNGGDLLTSTPDLEVIDSPEPSTWALMLTGAALVAVSRRKRSA